MEIITSDHHHHHHPENIMDMTVEAYQAGCSTPTRPEYRIPARSAPPPPPKKKKLLALGMKLVVPKNGYFHPPDLETLFALAPRPGPEPAWKLLQA